MSGKNSVPPKTAHKDMFGFLKEKVLLKKNLFHINFKFCTGDLKYQVNKEEIG